MISIVSLKQFELSREMTATVVEPLIYH